MTWRSIHNLLSSAILEKRRNRVLLGRYDVQRSNKISQHFQIYIYIYIYIYIERERERERKRERERERESSLNLCMGRPPTGVMIPDAE